MEIGRRELLAGAATLGLVTMFSPLDARPVAAEDPAPPCLQLHPLTSSLLDRASRAGQQLDRSRVERVIREVAGEHGRPVIKWMDDPGRAFEHLRRYSPDELAQLPTAQFWPFPPPASAASEDAEERSIELYLHATQVLRVEEHARALMTPKLSYKAQAMASLSRPSLIFKARVLAAEIGWIEDFAAGSCGWSDPRRRGPALGGTLADSMEICHQLRVFEAFEYGLLATWETPDELVSLSVSPMV